MEGSLLAFGSALWLGVLTSISPCPLATNIAAISYIGKRVGSPGRVALAGVFYTLGRMIAYMGLGILIAYSVLSIPELSRFLQKDLNKFLGPLLILTGFFLLDIIRFSMPGGGISQKMQGRVEKWGVWGAGILGFIFALSFCPVSAALFFGSLIPLAIKNNSGLIFPSIYGFGTALPVIIFAFIIGFGTNLLSRSFNIITRIEVWARKITGAVFIIVGVYYSLIYIFGLPI